MLACLLACALAKVEFFHEAWQMFGSYQLMASCVLYFPRMLIVNAPAVAAARVTIATATISFFDLSHYA